MRVTFTLHEANALSIQYEARAEKDTLVNLTNHSYFNLNGGGSVLDHELQVFASRITENDAGCLPTGRLLEVEQTPFDFRIPKQIGAEIDADDAQLRCGGGYDHNYVLSGRRAAVLRSGRSGIEMIVETDQPGMQVYTANGLTRAGQAGQYHGPPGCGLLGDTAVPQWHSSLWFPSPVLRAGESMYSETVFSFGLC